MLISADVFHVKPPPTSNKSDLSSSDFSTFIRHSHFYHHTSDAKKAYILTVSVCALTLCVEWEKAY